MNIPAAQDFGLLAAIERRLAANRLAYGVLDLQNGARLLILERGAAAQSALSSPRQRRACRWARALADAEVLGAFVRSDQWMIGGESAC